MSDSAVAAGLDVAVPPGPQLVVFACSGYRFAVPLDRVREILTPHPLTRLPGCGAEVCGLTGVRGRVVTVFDLGVVLTGRPSVAQADHRLLLIDHGERVLGAAVDEVLAVMHADIETFGPNEPILEGLPARRAEAMGGGTFDDQRFVLLDIESIIRRLLA